MELQETTPSRWKAKLDGDLLCKMGLTRDWMQRGAIFFFYQLLLPVCNPARSGITSDPPFYIEVTIHTNSYDNKVKQWNGDYGHKFNPTTATECVRCNDITVRNNNSNIGSCWDQTSKNQYDPMVDDSFGLW